MIPGIDISKWQGQPDFNKVKNSQKFVIMKASEGNGLEDATQDFNQAECRKQGILVGYYHFARPDLRNEPEAEAAWFLRCIQGLQTGEMLVLDYEPQWNGDAVGWCKRWLDFVFSMTGVKPLIYLNQSQVKAYNWKPVIDGDYGLWLAQYDNDPEKVNGSFPWKFVAMKQWSSSGKVSGISGNVDMNSFFGDEATFKKYGFNPGATPIPDPTPPPDLNADEKRAWDNFVNHRKTNNEGPEGNNEGMMARMIGRDLSYKQLVEDKENASQAAENLQKELDETKIQRDGYKSQVDSYQQFVDDLWKTLNVNGSNKPKSTETILAEVVELIAKEDKNLELNKALDNCTQGHNRFVTNVREALKLSSADEKTLLEDIKKYVKEKPPVNPTPQPPSHPAWQFWHWFGF